jgi:hypothetical protein
MSFQHIQDPTPMPLVPGSLMSKIGKAMPLTDRKSKQPVTSFTFREKRSNFNFFNPLNLPAQLQKPLVTERQRLKETYKGLSKSRLTLQNTRSEAAIHVLSKQPSVTIAVDQRPTVMQHAENFVQSITAEATPFQNIMEQFQKTHGNNEDISRNITPDMLPALLEPRIPKIIFKDKK